MVEPLNNGENMDDNIKDAEVVSEVIKEPIKNNVKLDALERRVDDLDMMLHNAIDHLKLVTQTLEMTKIIVTRLIINPESLQRMIRPDGLGLDLSILNQLNQEEYEAHPIFLAGKSAASNLDPNPYEDGTIDAQRWADGRHAGVAAITAELETTDTETKLH